MALEVSRTVEVTLRSACPKCGAPIAVHGAHLSVPCVCGNRVGVPTAVLAAALEGFEEERKEGALDRGGAEWRWTARRSTPEGPGSERVQDAPVLLVAQVPNALRVHGGDDGETVYDGPGPRWWVEVAGLGRAEDRRRKRKEQLERQADIDAARLREYERSLAEAERHKAEQLARRIEERVEHEQTSQAVLGMAWAFVIASTLGMTGTTWLLSLGTDLPAPDVLIALGRVMLVVVGGMMGVFGLTVSSLAAAYRVHEPLLAYVGFSLLVAFGAAIPVFGVVVAMVYGWRLSRGRDPTLRGVRRTTPGGGRPMAAALLTFCATVQIGVIAVAGGPLAEVYGLLAEGFGF